MTLTMIEITARLLRLPTFSTTAEHHAFRTRCATTTATLYNNILRCRCYGKQQQHENGI